MKKNKNKFEQPTEHCYWVWFKQPVKGEMYLSVLKKTPEDALNAAGNNRHKVDRIVDVYDIKQYEVSRGTIIY